MNWDAEVPLDGANRSYLPIAQSRAPTFWEQAGHYANMPFEYLARQQQPYDESLAAGSKAVAEHADRAIDEISSPGFLDHVTKNIGASFDEGVEVNNSNADLRARSDAYQSVVDAVNKSLPPDRQVINPELADPVTYGVNPFGGDLPARIPWDRATLESNLWRAVAEMKRRDPGAFAHLPDGPGGLEQQMHEAQRAMLAHAQQVGAESGPVARGLGTIIGGGGAGFEDPVNLLAMGLGSPASTTLLRTFAIEGVLNAGADAVTMPQRFQRLENLGEPAPSASDIAGELGGDFLLGGALPVGIKLAGRGLKHLVAHFDARFPNPGEDARAARNAAADMARREEDNPYHDSVAGRDEFRETLHAATQAVDNREPLPEVRPLHPDDRAFEPPPFYSKGEFNAALEHVTLARSRVPETPTLFAQIKNMGGIALPRDAGGKLTKEAQDIASVLLDVKRPGLINKDGRTPDYLREALQERGWFGPRADQGADLQDLYDLMTREAHGEKIYHPESETLAALHDRATLDEELGRAGVAASDKPEVAADKLARFREHLASDLIRHRLETQADRALDGLPPEILRGLEDDGFDGAGYVPGADIGAEHEAPSGAGEAASRSQPEQGTGRTGGQGADLAAPGDGARETPGTQKLEDFADPADVKTLAAQSDALERELDLKKLPRDLAVPDMEHLGLVTKGDRPVTLKAVLDELARDKNAVAKLRSCIGGGEQ